MRSVHCVARKNGPAETLVVLLPGAMHGPADFLREGFAQAVQQRGMEIDLQLAELQFEHVASEQAMSQLESDIVAPALGAGYRALWLAGISIGGYVAINYADRFPGRVHGLFLIAPYPGNRMTTNEIIAAGGIGRWSPEVPEPHDVERRNWWWLKNQRDIELHLGYGAEDRFAPAHAMMAEALRMENVDQVAGGHDWAAWHTLWGRFLDRRFGGARD